MSKELTQKESDAILSKFRCGSYDGNVKGLSLDSLELNIFGINIIMTMNDYMVNIHKIRTNW